jgi:hypothetical protein
MPRYWFVQEWVHLLALSVLVSFARLPIIRNMNKVPMLNLLFPLASLDGHQRAGPKREYRVARVPGQGLPVQQGGPKHVHGANLQVAH